MRSASILVVEDDENLRILLANMAEKYFPTVDLAVDGVEALDLLRERSYELVLLDLMLPRINGVEVADAIAKMKRPPKVVVLSAIARYFKDHFSDDVVVLQKPFDMHVLEDLLRTHSKYAPRERA